VDVGDSIGFEDDDAYGPSPDAAGYDDYSSYTEAASRQDFSPDSFLSDSMQEAMQSGLGASAIGLGMSQAEFNAATGRTATNPFPNSFFSQLLGSERVDYTGIVDVADQNRRDLERYNNPIDNEGNIRGSVGDDTAFGKITEIDKRMSPTETLMRAGVGSFMPGPVGLILSQLGTSQKAIEPIAGIEVPTEQVGQGFNYDPKLDPRNPEYEGPTSFLGKMGSGFERLLFGGARPVTKTGQGIMDLIQGQDAERAMGGYETFDGKKM